MEPPAYFESVRKSASGRWDQLERDPELAGPWHQLFKQVQSPRHVLSELLQNADDAGATEAAVGIEDGEFIFSHDGEDFSQDHFASLCRFGYSNKRVLHTIGFRGIGFKCTFSLGDEVRLFTPTLSVSFHKTRFTEPVWFDRTELNAERTEVRVPIKDDFREQELKKNLAEWFRSPASLLFFKHIRALRIGKQEVRWVSTGAGPVENSEWMELSTAPGCKYLLLRSPVEDFPEDALEEIRQERMVSADDEKAFPPSRVEIVLGLQGRLFVILPTGVKTTLPFACNAPFVQDPARVKLKDPETSPTNRWLLGRVGELAAQSALAWLGKSDLGVGQRSEAYGLFPDVDPTDTSLEGTCANLAGEAFDRSINHTPFLLTEGGTLRERKGCVAVPSVLLNIWSPQQVSTFFDPLARPVLSQAITTEHRLRLVKRGCVTQLERTDVVAVLAGRDLPIPETMAKVLVLWVFVSEDIVGYSSFQVRVRRDPKDIRIVPVQGKEVLFAAKAVVRLGERQFAQPGDEWGFLTEHLLAMDPRWPRFLAEHRRKAEEDKDVTLAKQISLAYAVLTATSLHETSDVNRVFSQMSGSFFARTERPLRDSIRLAHMAAFLGANVPEEFEYATEAGTLRPVGEHVLMDETGDLGAFVDSQSEWYRHHVLHGEYARVPTGLTEVVWRQWAVSDRSRLLTFAPLMQLEETKRKGRDALLEWLQARGLAGAPYFHYRTDKYLFQDWNFSGNMWSYWESLAKQSPAFWAHLLVRILEQPVAFWTKSVVARVVQISTNGAHRPVTDEALIPAWLLKFRQLPCLQDTWGAFRQPAELLRRTPATEALLGVEPFIRAELDTEAARPLLVKLGVRDTPTGPDRLLDSLRALAKAGNPPIHEVEKWYHRLDQILDRCSTTEAQQLFSAFANEKIIRTEVGGWARVAEVFLHPDEGDVPDAAVIHPSFRHLSLWRKVGVADRPTIELALGWLRSLPTAIPLSQDEVRRVRALLPKDPERIWLECRHWLNLEGEWVPVESLSYSMSMQSLISWKRLFPAIKKKTADLQKLPAALCLRPPFSGLESLADCIEDRFQDQAIGLPDPRQKPWLSALGNGLRRITVEGEEETRRLKDLGSRLAGTLWQVAAQLETIPYIDGTPAGTPKGIEVLWKGSILYVDGRSTAKIAKAVAQELGRVFGRQEVADAIKLCYDRSPAFVVEYLEENFELGPLGEPETVDPEEADTVTAGDSEQRDPVTECGQADADRKEPEPRTEDSRAVELGEVAGKQSNEADVEPGENVVAEGEGALTERRSKAPKAPQPSLIERFAFANGFIQNGDDRFYLPDGTWIGKTRGSSFSWERRSPSGDLLQYYWAKEHCIQAEPLQLAAEVWGLCEKFPDQYSLILLDPSGAPEEVSGHRLKEMCTAGLLVLHPASYRLVYGSHPAT